ncbi:MAG: hypothetical protein LBG62_00595 [Candidatus Methanoplasma sp.]|jgi:hypothetical protein|nr:hypothetical protein [Candidatus Methanoplasma sp.]
MKRGTARLYVVFGALFLSAFALGIAYADDYGVGHLKLYLVVSMAMPGASFLCSGAINCFKERGSGGGYDREGLMAWSMLAPGYTHARLMGERARGAAMLSVFLAGVAIASFGAGTIFFSGSLDPDSSVVNALLCLIGTDVAMSGAVWSALEVNEYCNGLGLPHEGGPFEMNFYNTPLGLKILAVLSASSLILLASAFPLGGYI